MKKYDTIDIFKFIMAVVIIMLHTAPFSGYSKVLSYGIRNIFSIVAVPFFFISSGFLIKEKSDYSKKYVKKYIFRTIKLYLIWTVIYFPFVFINWMKNGFSYKNILVYVRNFLFEGSYYTIWFLPALCTAVLIVYLLHKKFTYSQLFLISIPFYIFALFGSSYYGLAVKNSFLQILTCKYFCFFDSIKNGLLFGFVYVAMGACISDNLHKINLSLRSNIFFVLIFWILLAVEQIILSYLDWNTKGVDTVLFLLPLSFFIFVFVVKLHISDIQVSTFLRKLSILMFLSQRIFISIIELCFTDSVIFKNSMFYFLTILICSTLFSCMIIFLSKKIKFLNNLY